MNRLAFLAAVPLLAGCNVHSNTITVSPAANGSQGKIVVQDKD